MNEPTYLSILTESQLNDYCQQILANSDIAWIAIDTEFVRVDTYFPKLSLVQIEDCLGNAAIIDPLAIQSSSTQQQPLHALVELLADKSVVKVFHSARQDIEVLYQLEGIMPQAIFDTQIAAIFRKHGEIAGFARVIENELGHTLAKSQTRTNWHQRPLTAEQIEYALDDVRYLAPLYKKYLQELTATQLQAVHEDSEALLNESLYRCEPALAGKKIKNTKGLKGKGLAIVNSLAEWREIYAIENDKPKKWVLSDDAIVQIAKRPPKTEQALYKVSNIKSSSVKAYGSEWIALIDEVFALSAEQLPKPPAKPLKETADEEPILSLLQAYIQQTALAYNLNSQHLISRELLIQLLRQPQQAKLSGWKKELVGDGIQRLLNGQAQLTTENQTVILQPSH